MGQIRHDDWVYDSATGNWTENIWYEDVPNLSGTANITTSTRNGNTIVTGTDNNLTQNGNPTRINHEAVERRTQERFGRHEIHQDISLIPTGGPGSTTKEETYEINNGKKNIISKTTTKYTAINPKTNKPEISKKYLKPIKIEKSKSITTKPKTKMPQGEFRKSSNNKGFSAVAIAKKYLGNTYGVGMVGGVEGLARAPLTLVEDFTPYNFEKYWKNPEYIISTDKELKTGSKFVDYFTLASGIVDIGNALETTAKLRKLGKLKSPLKVKSLSRNANKEFVRSLSATDISDYFPLTDLNEYKIISSSVSKADKIPLSKFIFGRSAGTQKLIKSGSRGAKELKKSKFFSVSVTKPYNKIKTYMGEIKPSLSIGVSKLGKKKSKLFSSLDFELFPNKKINLGGLKVKSFTRSFTKSGNIFSEGKNIFLENVKNPKSTFGFKNIKIKTNSAQSIPNLLSKSVENTKYNFLSDISILPNKKSIFGISGVTSKTINKKLGIKKSNVLIPKKNIIITKPKTKQRNLLNIKPKLIISKKVNISNKPKKSIFSLFSVKQKNITRTKIATKAKAKQRPKRKTKPINIIKPRKRMKILPKIKISPKTKSRAKTKLRSKMPSPHTPPNPFDFPRQIITFPKIDFNLFYQRNRKKLNLSTKKRHKYKYEPSINAIFFGVRSKRKTKTKGIFSNLEYRPIIKLNVNKKRKSKKRSKRKRKGGD